MNDKKHDGLPVKGYVPQSNENVRLVNENKLIEEEMLRRLDDLSVMPDIDKRWLAVGRTHIEQAFMAINRSVFKPERVKFSADE